MDSLILFGNSRFLTSNYLVAEALRAASRVEGLEVVAVCDATQTPSLPPLLRIARDVGVATLKSVFDHRRRLEFRPGAFDDLRCSARRAGVPVLVPNGRDVNHPQFVAELRTRLRPNLALALGCAQIFREPLLASFESVVNLHDSLVPRYRGLWATRWSIYAGEQTSGFSFHRMDASIDTGPVLLAGELVLGDAPDPGAVEGARTRLAARSLEEVLRRLVARDPGRPQTGEASYYGRRELQAIRRIEAPECLSWTELQRRLRIFDTLDLKLGGSYCEVTRLDRVESGNRSGSRLRFRTQDGVEVAATRLGFLPPRIYYPLRRLGLVPPPPSALTVNPR